MNDDRFQTGKTEQAVRFLNRVVDAMASHTDLSRTERVELLCDLRVGVDDPGAGRILYGELAYDAH